MLGSIQISGSNLSDAQVKDICSSVAEHKVPLLTLRKCKTKDKNFRSLAKAVGKSKALLQLNLNLGLVSSRNRVFSLADSLHVNRSISTLLLYGSQLGDKGVIVLCEALVHHPQVVTLDIGNCGLTDISIPYVAQLLPNYGAKPGLHELTLSANKSVTLTGWTQFAMAMANGCHLRSLYVDYNQLGDPGVGCFAVALAATKSLKLLDLESCGISTIGAQLFLHLLGTHETGICKIVLRGNTISRSVMTEIQEIMYERNQQRLTDSNDEYESMSSTSESSEVSEDNQLQPKPVQEDLITNANDQVVESSNKISHEDPPTREPAKRNSEQDRLKGYDFVDNDSISDISSCTDELPKQVSSEDSRLKTEEEYPVGEHTVYSNMYIQEQQHVKQKTLPESERKSMDDEMFSHIMRTSVDGYG